MVTSQTREWLYSEIRSPADIDRFIRIVNKGHSYSWLKCWSRKWDVRINCSRVVWFAMWMLLAVIFDRSASQKPPRTNALDRVPRIPMIMIVVLYATRTLRAPGFRAVVVTASLLLVSIWKSVVTSSVQSTVVDIVNDRNSCWQEQMS